MTGVPQKSSQRENAPKSSKAFRVFAAAAIVATVIIIGLIFKFQRPRSRVSPQSTNVAADNPVEHFVISATLAPGMKLQALPWSSRLPPNAVDEFDVSGDGVILIRLGGKILDLTSGSILVDGNVRSFAFADDALAVITEARRFAYFADDGLRELGPVPLEASRLSPVDDGQGLLLLRDTAPHGLAALASDGSLRPLSGSPRRIDAVAGTPARHIFSIDSELYYQENDAAPELVLRLPEKDATIVGLAFHGDDIYFSTRRNVYAIRGSLAVPLALGCGGPLRMTRDGLVILNSNNGRLYRLVTNSG